MGIGHVELQGGLQRLQDFSVIRQNEENRPEIEQLQNAADFIQEAQENSSRVADTARTDTEGELDQNAGGEEYAGDGGRGRRKKTVEEKEMPSEGVVFMKSNDPSAKWHSLKGGDFSITI